MGTEAKTAFNLKVLQRHDPSITAIIDSASFVVLYNHQSEWTKTGVEGPMFLFRRNKAPYHGFFIMNRNGVENFSADMTPEDDLEITPEFIIYRPDSSDEHDVYGIWIFESSQRFSIGEQMVTLQQMSPPLSESAPVAAPKDPTAQVSQGLSTQPAQLPGAQKQGTISMNAPVGGSAPQESLSQDEASLSQKASHEASLLNALFQTASIRPAAIPAETNKAEPLPAAASAGTHDSSSQNLLALLGVRPASDTTPVPDLPSLPSSTTAPAQQARDPAANTSRQQNGGHPAPGPPNSKAPETAATASAAAPPTANGTPAKPAPKMSELLADGIKGRVGLGDDGQPLSRREFVRELLSLIHTETSFVDEIHRAYLDQVSL